MFELMGTFLWILITAVASIGGYIAVKRFVNHRLRYVDAVKRPYIPALAGAFAFGAALPLAVLPIFTGVSAVLFGISVGAGVAAGRKEFKQLPGA